MADMGLKLWLRQTHSIPLNIKLHCQNNEVLALVGPSGSGKTTVLRAIAGLYAVENGMIECQKQCWLDTKKAINIASHQRAVGFVFQNYALFPHLSAQENVAIGLSYLSKMKRLERAKVLLKKVHLEGLEKRYPVQLSGGQQQRVAVARALARAPKILLLDEPFSAVDQVTRRRLYKELIELRRSLSIPIILVTHDLNEANLLADRMCLLHHGVSLQSGSPTEVSTFPVSTQVAKLMDQPNIFTAKIVEQAFEKKITRLRWCGKIIEARYRANYRAGQKICWMIPASDVILHRRRKSSKGVHENPFSGKIVDYMLLGGYVTVSIEINQRLKTYLSMSVPLHVARRNELALGIFIGVSLLADSIHLMPYESLRNEF
ncbi:MAG: ABC transporter ATP-binding protein [Methylococcales bacterium]|nr:ABC transporter ATP-binding protein [Methylococcales bacterium]